MPKQFRLLPHTAGVLDQNFSCPYPYLQRKHHVDSLYTLSLEQWQPGTGVRPRYRKSELTWGKIISQFPMQREDPQIPAIAGDTQQRLVWMTFLDRRSGCGDRPLYFVLSECTKVLHENAPFGTTATLDKATRFRYWNGEDSVADVFSVSSKLSYYPPHHDHLATDKGIT